MGPNLVRPLVLSLKDVFQLQACLSAPDGRWGFLDCVACGESKAGSVLGGKGVLDSAGAHGSVRSAAGPGDFSDLG